MAKKRNALPTEPESERHAREVAEGHEAEAEAEPEVEALGIVTEELETDAEPDEEKLRCLRCGASYYIAELADGENECTDRRCPLQLDDRLLVGGTYIGK